MEVTLVTLGGSDTLAFTQQFIPGHSAHTIQFALIIILGVLIGPMCAHIGGTHECGEVQSHALVVSIADGDTTTLVDGGFATEYCFALHACKMSWVVVLLKEVQLKQDFSSRGLVPAFCRLLRISDPTVLGEGALYRCKMFEMWPLPLYSCTTCASVHDYHVLWQLDELTLDGP